MVTVRSPGSAVLAEDVAVPALEADVGLLPLHCPLGLPVDPRPGFVQLETGSRSCRGLE
jgi:hypothetical protein